MTDFRALCAELVDVIGTLVGGVNCGHYQQRHMWECRRIFERAHAALAEPQPEPPTDEELWEVYDQMDGIAEDWAWTCDYARAVLARWGGAS